MTRLQRLAVTLALLASPSAARSQTADIPDTVLVRLLSPALFEAIAYSTARAALGGQRIVRLRLPEGDAWRPIGEHVMRVVNGRPYTEADTAYESITLDGVAFRGDTLTATVSHGGGKRCPSGQWMGSSTGYDLMAVRHGKAWTEVKRTTTTYSDGWCMSQPPKTKPTTPAYTAPRPLDSIKAPRKPN
jgi:hypothetical protein